MPRFLVAAAVAVVFFTIYALVDCLMTDRQRARGIPKALWIVVILVITPIGGILWLTLGKDRSRGGTASRRIAPDGDVQTTSAVGEENSSCASSRTVENTARCTNRSRRGRVESNVEKRTGG